MANSKENFADLLRTEGITFKGFGVIPKMVTLSTSLTIEAKAIYAYFASYAGGGSCAFPSRDKILSDLKISKNRYYKHFRLLVDSGLVGVEKEEGTGFTRNIYVLKQGTGSGDDAAVTMEGIKASGYGMIPKAVILDERLAIEAKGIYAYYASFTGSGKECTPSVNTICYHTGISDKRYIRYRNELEALGYISVARLHKDGLLSNVKITLLDNPNIMSSNERTVDVVKTNQSVQNEDTVFNQSVQNEDTGKMGHKKPVTLDNIEFDSALVNQRVQNKDTHQSGQNEDIQNQSVQNEDIQNEDTNNNSYNINKYNNNKINKREVASPDLYRFSCPVGSLEISKDEKEKLDLAFENVNALLELAVCSLSQRRTMPKSIFHFVWELGIEKNWKRKAVDAVEKKAKAPSQEEKLVEMWNQEAEAEFEKNVRNFMKEEGLTDFEEAASLYEERIKENARKSIAMFLGK